MKSYLVKTPKLVQRMFPKRVWAFPNESDTIYLTFDDGPIPEVTPWVLETLKKYQAKATFFCIGDNVGKHPDVFSEVIKDGHTIGNHTDQHLNGWKTDFFTYNNNVLKAEFQFRNASLPERTTLFRPPYGRLSNKQAKRLKPMGYTIVMWDVLSADFHPKVSEEECLQNVLKHIQPGSIVVFHDSLKAEKNLRYALPKVLDYISEKNWSCKGLVSG